MKKQSLREVYSKYEEKILYLIFWGITTVISFVVQGLGATFLGTTTHTGTTLTTILSWISAVTFAYLTNKKYVFKSKCMTRKELYIEILSFYSARLLSLGIEVLSMNVFAVTLSINYWGVKFMVQIIIIIGNYILSKTIIFKESDRT